MGQLMNLVQQTFFLNKFSFFDRPTLLQLQKYHVLQLSFQGYTITLINYFNNFCYLFLLMWELLLTGNAVSRVESLFEYKVL